ncbi:MAG: phage holin family protein [Dysgonamonadaceae bacterium]|jgi:hypothetical protein|nr:phage holin family protein [Dysgonamonadaceae bacterium]
MEREYNLGTLLSVLKEDVTELINTKLAILKLDTFEKTSKVGSFLTYGLIVVNLVFFAFLFLFLALGFLIGQSLHNYAAGFAIVALIYLVLLLIILLARKSIITSLQNTFLKELL